MARAKAPSGSRAAGAGVVGVALSLVMSVAGCNVDPLPGQLPDWGPTVGGLDMGAVDLTRRSGEPPDLRIADLAVPDLLSLDLSGPDLAGASYHLRWSVLLDDQPASCAQAGIDRVKVCDSPGCMGLFALVDCAPLEATIGPYESPYAFGTFRQAFDANLVRLAISQTNQAVTTFGKPGVVTEMPSATFYITSEPIPQMRAIFEGARAFYKARGSLPQSSPWTPNAVGVCCASADGLCSVLGYAGQWLGGAWADIGFSMSKSRFRYSYQFTSYANPTRFTVEASADIDCSGRLFSHYQIDGTLVNGDFTGVNNVAVVNPGE